MPLHRRRLLTAGATAGLVSLAGCLDAFDDGARSTDGETSLRLYLSEAPTPLRSEYVVDFEDTERPWDAEAFDAAVAGETYTTQHRTPFGSRPDDPRYARRDGTYYQLGHVVVNERAVTHPVVRLFGAAETEDSNAPEAVDAGSLSEADQTVVHIAHMAARARGNEGGAPWGLIQRGGFVFRDDADAAESRLVGDDAPSHVAYRGRVYELRVSRERFYEAVYRATVEPVAETPERMEAILRAQFVDARLSRESLSAEARSILRTARGEGYAETHPYSRAYRAVLTALDARAYLDGDIENDAYAEDPGDGMARYDGRYYDYRLRLVEG